MKFDNKGESLWKIMEKKEVNEALHAIEETLGHLSRAQDYLSSAGNWGLFDMIGGGFITTMIKHGKMNEAERAMAAARNSIRNLKKELSDVDQLVDVDLNISDFLSFADYFLMESLLIGWFNQRSKMLDFKLIKLFEN
ncbi:MAG: hypothetical protein V8R63_01815 [Thomasclavelia ramosa]